MNTTRWNETLFCVECASLLLNACILVSVLVQRIWWTLGSAIHLKSSQCHTSCNVTGYQLWRGPSSETKGQLVGGREKIRGKNSGKKSQELLIFLRPNFFSRPFRLLKIRAKKSQELLTFLLPIFFLAGSDFSLPPLTAPVSEWMWRGPVQSPAKRGLINGFGKVFLAGTKRAA